MTGSARREREKLLKDLEDRGWQVTKGKNYYTAWCPCGKHRVTVHLTPSDPTYWFNRRKHTERICQGQKPREN